MTRRRAGHPLAGRLQLGEVQPAKAIQERFGHSSITVTLDRYGYGYGYGYPNESRELAKRL